MYTLIDMSKDPRHAQYELFTGYRYPFVGVTAKVDVSGLVQFCRKRAFSFYAAMVRVATVAANRVPELRRRIIGGEVREYDLCHASITEMGSSGVYYYCTLYPQADWETYIPYAQKTRAAKRNDQTLEEEADSQSAFFVTCVPGISFEQLIMPYSGTFTNPSISWGKYEEDWRGRLMLPVSILCHHGLADGAHITAFYKYLEEELGRLPQ